MTSEWKLNIKISKISKISKILKYWIKDSKWIKNEKKDIPF